MPMNQNNRIMNLANRAVSVYEYFSNRDAVDEEKAIAELGLKRPELYRQLLNLKDQPKICQKGRFNIFRNHQALTVEQVTDELQSGKRRFRGPQPLERILYLYQYLQQHTSSGGVDMADLRSLYRHIIRESDNEPAGDMALKRMIYRDIEELEEIGISVARPANGHRYALMNTVLPKMKQEHNVLMYVSTLLFQNTLLDEASACVRDQMGKVCFKNVMNNTRWLQKKVRVVSDTLINPDSFGGTLETIITGLMEHKAVQFQYLKLDGSSMGRTLEPLGLICKRGVWYLVGMYGKRKAYRTFRIDQITAVQMLEQSYVYPEYFELERYLNNSWGVFNDDELTPVLVKFSPDVAERLKIVRYHASQAIQEIQPDGSLVVQYQISGLTEMKSWIMQWGDSAEVLSPEGLRSELKEQAQKLLALYSQQEAAD